MTDHNRPFSHAQLRSLDIAARVSACLSLAGASFTIVSFLSHPPLRKPVNRLVFCIAVSNVFGCLAYSWGRHPIAAGRDSAWCQTQAMFITWFVMTDPLLVMVMAFNVLLTVRTKRNAQELKKIDMYGVFLAFGAPFVPALVFLCWRPDGRTVYGDATLWCWISKESKILRLAEFYIPIWTSLLITIILFALSGKQILRVRRKLNLAKSDLGSDDQAWQTQSSQERRPSLMTRTFLSRNSSADPRRPPLDLLGSYDPSPAVKGMEPFTPIHSHEVPESRGVSPLTTTLSPTLDRRESEQSRARKQASRFDRMHWKYAKFALLCTLVLLITWVPISINRVYNNFINPDNQIYGLYLASAACIPLHGFGNFIIYTTTSWTDCRNFITCASRRAKDGGSRR